MNREIDMRANKRPLGHSGMVSTLACIVLLTSATLSFGAQTVKPDPDPGIPGEGFVDYVGNYGEVLKLRGGWRIEASMHDEAEVINQYPPFRVDLRDSVEPFNPQPADFVPENFTRYALIQLIILPRTAASTKSLDELKKLKIKDLESSGVGFKIVDQPFFGGLYGNWPKDTFEIFVSTPYRLSQLYTASDSHLCILTSGRDTPPSTVISSHYEWMRSGLRDWVAPPTRLYELLEPHTPTPRKILAKGVSLRVLGKPVVWMSWALVSGISCLLAGFLGIKKRWAPLRRASLWLLIFSNAGALIGGVVGLFFWPFAWSSHHLPVPSTIACLFMPLLVFLANRVRGIRYYRRALFGVAAWAIIAAIFLCYVSLASNWGSNFSPLVPAYTAMSMFVFYGVGGIFLGFLDGPPSDAVDVRALLALAFFLFLSPKAEAQSDSVLIQKALPNSIDGGIDFNARAALAEKGLTKNSMHGRAVANLRQTQVLYKFQRVEVKGVWIKEDTNKFLPDMFDKQIEPSHVGDKDDSTIAPTPAWIQAVINRAMDLGELTKDARQEISKTALKTVEELQGQEVNEIVAHSWGTEIIYNAILAGAIKPPRRLIVAGMPDRDIEKWAALSKYTGTEVITYPDSHDPAAGFARSIGEIRDRISENLKIVRGPGQFEQQWATACGIEGRVCNEHGRQAPQPSHHSAYLVMSICQV